MRGDSAASSKFPRVSSSQLVRVSSFVALGAVTHLIQARHGWGKRELRCSANGAHVLQVKRRTKGSIEPQSKPGEVKVKGQSQP